jgi:hypothetical protein
MSEQQPLDPRTRRRIRWTVAILVAIVLLFYGSAFFR